MRALVQRVAEASVAVDGKIAGAIDGGLLLLVGIGEGDTLEDFEWIARKIVNLRIFNDQDGAMNRSVRDTGGGILAISQFTLFASTRKGSRPSWSNAAAAAAAEPLFEQFLAHLSMTLGRPVATGVFGADMRVALTNDGPVTIWLDSRVRE